MNSPIHSIKSVVQRTGLSVHVIRVWEKRYGAVEPVRTLTKRRLYTEDQVQRLLLLKALTEAGHSIKQVANLSVEQLRQYLASAKRGELRSPGMTAPTEEGEGGKLIGEALSAIRAMDPQSFERTLERAGLRLGCQGMLMKVAAPVAQEVGRLWRSGEITSAHEHLATVVFRRHLCQTACSFSAMARGPILVTTTPAGQIHELGSLLVAALASNLGWRVCNLGPNLPATEIASTVLSQKASALALSIVYPPDDPGLPTELARLRSLLPAELPIFAGGQAAPAYASALDGIGALRADTLDQLGGLLDAVRTGRQPR